MRGLTDRQLEIVRLVADGCSNREIAARLCVTVNTVRTHLKHIYNVVGASSRTALVANFARGDLLGMVKREPEKRRPEEMPQDERSIHPE
ncbi:MAG: LuxR C-terminal-related transcriptional regulator [Dehalococcoidia bacterium]|nr:LuxR C-terminal-related transcriptional regulator [Dehalococcoidia bacterium]